MASRWWILSIITVTMIAFSPAVTLFYLWDDFNLVKTAGNTPIQTLFTMEIFGYYRPVLMLSYAL